MSEDYYIPFEIQSDIIKRLPVKSVVQFRSVSRQWKSFIKIKMSDYYIPFEIQSEILKRLPVKSLVRFRSVSKLWRAFIDSPEFIKTYHINHPNPYHHLLVRYKLDRVQTYTSIIDDNTFPQQKFPLTIPDPLSLLKYRLIGCVDGLICFYHDDERLKTKMCWNPSVRKCVGIVITNVLHLRVGYTRIAFGVCPDTNDPKLVKINVVETPTISWEVQVFTLSSGVWKTVYTGAPIKSCDLIWNHVFIDGSIYWRTSGSFLILLDLKSEKFGEVCLPERTCIYHLRVVKVNESLGLLEYKPFKEGEMWVCSVWMRTDGVNQTFTEIYTIKVEGESVFNRVLAFRNNGEVVLQLDDDDFEGSHIEVYEPSSGRSNSVGISGERLTFSAWSYMETLLLLHQSNSIIH